MSSSEPTKPFLTEPPASSLLSSPTTAPPYVLSHGLLVKLPIPWDFSCLDIPPDILMAHTSPTLKSLLLKSHFVTDLLSKYKSTLCHFLFSYCIIFFPSAY